jgi:hypothetical protein
MNYETEKVPIFNPTELRKPYSIISVTKWMLLMHQTQKGGLTKVFFLLFLVETPSWQTRVQKYLPLTPEREEQVSGVSFIWGNFFFKKKIPLCVKINRTSTSS